MTKNQQFKEKILTIITEVVDQNNFLDEMFWTSIENTEIEKNFLLENGETVTLDFRFWGGERLFCVPLTHSEKRTKRSLCSTNLIILS